jgi:hypothetical protein
MLTESEKAAIDRYEADPEGEETARLKYIEDHQEEIEASRNKLKPSLVNLRAYLDMLDRLGYMKPYGVDYDKLERDGLLLGDNVVNMEALYEMDRNTSSS